MNLPRPSPRQPAGQRAGTRPGPRLLPLTALLMMLLELAFLVWNVFNLSYLRGWWAIMTEMEGPALAVSPWQRLSLMLPLWIGLGVLVYNLGLVALLSAWRRSQALPDRAPES